MKQKVGKPDQKVFKKNRHGGNDSGLSLKQQKRNRKKQEKLLQEKSGKIGAKKETQLPPPPPVSNGSVYKRQSLFPAPSPAVEINRFLTAKHNMFSQVLKQSYAGFVLEPAEKYDEDFLLSYRTALAALETAGFYQYDMTQPAGLRTKIARTFVTRCLVGDPGMTYKYLGLRMFAHPWSEGAVGATPSTVAIGRMNEILKQRALELNQQHKTVFGSCEFNLTLINYCFPAGDGPMPLKKEPLFNVDNMSVSWHADSSLDHFSTIAVYHWDKCDRPNNSNKMKDAGPQDWRIALRVAINAEGPQQGKPQPPSIPEITAPPIAVIMPPEGCYYLLDDFNHHHQHAVLAGSSHRFASTHRVSRVEGHSFSYIHSRCQNLLLDKPKADKGSIRRVLLTIMEVEFEWLCQFYIQGQAHHSRLIWWHEPIKTLLDQLLELEKRLVKQYLAVKIARLGPDSVAEWSVKQQQKLKNLAATISSATESAQEMLALLQERVEKRNGWHERAEDAIFLTCPMDCRPMEVPMDEIYAAWLKVGGMENAMKKLHEYCM